MSGGPSFDDVPASAAPNRQLAASYAYRDRERGRSPSPTYSSHELARTSLDSPYRPSKEKWTEDTDMNRYRPQERGTDLPPLQANSNLDEIDEEAYRPISDDDDPNSFDLVGPGQLEEAQKKSWNLEKQSQALFSKEHLQIIFGDPGFLLKFTSFLGFSLFKTTIQI